MIVTCQRCDTSFQLDDSRVPETGIRVRCSRCKEAFFLQHPSAGEEGAVHGIAGEAAEYDGAPPPGSTQDLVSESPARSGRRGEHAASGSEFEEEEDWEFNEGFPDDEGELEDDSDVIGDPLDVADAEEDDGVPLIGGDGMPSELQEDAQQASSEEDSAFGSMDDYSSLMEEDDASMTDAGPVAAPQPVAARAPAGGGAPAVEELGEPEDWDFFSDEGLEGASGGTAAPVAAPSTPTSERAAVAEPSWSESAASAPAASSASASVGAGLLAHLQTAGATLGWVVTIGLLVVGIGQGLRSSHASAAAGPRFVQLGALAAEAVQGSWVDTAQLGPVFTVTGRLRNSTRYPERLSGLLQVVLLDADGERLDHPPVLAGLALDRDGLRRLSPDVLDSARTHAARALNATEIRPGSPLEFMAAIEQVPAQAARFEIELVSAEEVTPPWITPSVVVPAESGNAGQDALEPDPAIESSPVETQLAPPAEIGQEPPAQPAAQPEAEPTPAS